MGQIVPRGIGRSKLANRAFTRAVRLDGAQMCPPLAPARASAQQGATNKKIGAQYRDRTWGPEHQLPIFIATVVGRVVARGSAPAATKGRANGYQSSSAARKIGPSVQARR